MQNTIFKISTLAEILGVDQRTLKKHLERKENPYPGYSKDKGEVDIREFLQTAFDTYRKNNDRRLKKEEEDTGEVDPKEIDYSLHGWVHKMDPKRMKEYKEAEEKATKVAMMQKRLIAVEPMQVVFSDYLMRTKSAYEGIISRTIELCDKNGLDYTLVGYAEKAVDECFKLNKEFAELFHEEFIKQIDGDTSQDDNTSDLLDESNLIDVGLDDDEPA